MFTQADGIAGEYGAFFNVVIAVGAAAVVVLYTEKIVGSYRLPLPTVPLGLTTDFSEFSCE